MTFTDREKFIVASTIMVSTSIAKKLPREVRAALLDYIRQKQCPSITNEDWHEIAEGINEHKNSTQKAMLTGFFDAVKNPFKTQGDPAATKLDAQIRENMHNIDLDEFKKGVETQKDEVIQKAFDKVKDMKNEYDDGK